jgi:transcriptional regulator with AAA-type ATPase domain
MGEKEEAAERGAQENAFIGRTRELSELRGALEQSLAGRGSCFLISGEPGIGKTRLADELAADACGSSQPNPRARVSARQLVSSADEFEV